MGLGLAGLKAGPTRRESQRLYPGFLRVRAGNDATTACVGAHAGADGGLIIAGTGSAAIARIRNKETIIGGRGFALGDDGSGSHIGLDAMRAAMRAYDRIGAASALTQDLIGHFNNDPVAMMNWAREAKPGDFGALAPRVFEHAARHDSIALMMATLTPARMLRVDDRIGRLKPGYRADLVHLTDEFQVAEVWRGGRRLNEVEVAA